MAGTAEHFPQLHQWDQVNDQWEAYTLTLPQAQFMTDVFVMSNQDKWMSIEDNRGGGIVVYNEESGNERYLNTNGGQGGLPWSLVTDVVQDEDRLIWVGTDEGICFFPIPDLILTNSPLTANIPIFEGGLLLKRDEYITSIAVDPANRKWFGTNLV